MVRPDTVIRWHRQLVRRKWAAFGRRGRLGRPAVPDTRDLIVRLAADNPTCGYLRIKGEMRKLGCYVSAATVRRVLHHRRIPPAPRRGAMRWEFLRAPLWRCPGLRPLHCCRHRPAAAPRRLLLHRISTRRVFFAGCTAHPDGAWVTRQARNLSWHLGDLPRPEILVRDRDSKFTAAFNEVNPVRGCPGGQDPSSRASSQRLSRALGAERPPRMPR